MAVWIELFSRRVVGWTLDSRMDAALLVEAVNRVLGQRRVQTDQLRLDTDKSSQYRATQYFDLPREREINCSMSANGSCQDNANTVAESFFSTLKLELDLDDNRKALLSPQKLQRGLASLIDGYYNLQRHHPTIGHLSPIDYNQQVRSSTRPVHSPL